MRRVTLGRNGPEIFPLVFGTLPLGPLQAGLDAAEGGRLIRHALERGVNFLDTAEMYGTYPHLREGLAGHRGDVVLASKTHAPTAAVARQHVERALRELNRDVLDVVHLHGARLAEPFRERAEVFEELLQLRAEGKIRWVGLSSHFVAAVRAAADHPEVDVIHPLINREGMGIVDGSAAQMAAAIAKAAANGKGIYAMKALAGGNLISEARAGLRYVLGLPGVHAVAVGMLSTAEIDANVTLFDEGAAAAEVWQSLEQRRRRFKVMEQFCSGCGSCVDACPNDALSVAEGHAAVNVDECILCGYCGAACPEFLIRVV